MASAGDHSWTSPAWVTAAALVPILLIGGAGTAYPLVGAAALLIAVALGCHVVGWKGIRLDPLEWLLVALALAIPLAQLIPLPFSLWSALPGREAAAETLSAAGIAGRAMPLSLDPSATLEALAAMLPAMVMLLAGRGLDVDGRMMALRAVLAVAATSAALGAVQIAIGASAYSPSYASAHLGQGIGLFTNRNHQAALLLIALCLLPTVRWGQVQRSPSALIAGALAILYVAGILATTSRMGLLLLPLALAVAGWRYRGRGKAMIALLLLGCLLFAILAWWQGALPRILARFDVESDLRLGFWRTSLAALDAFWPLGSGMGSFPSVYPLFESRTDLTPYYVNHAHQDYLELLLEAGAAGALGLALFVLWLGRRAVAAARTRTGATGMEAAACWAILILMLFSLSDYPLRMTSLMALFGLLCALAGPPRGTPVSSWPLARPVSAAFAAAIGAAALAGGWAEHLRSSGQAEMAARINPLSHEAHADVAAEALALKNYGDARKAATRALGLSPVDQRAVTILALALKADGQAEAGRRVQLAAAGLGWRDGPSQIWLLAEYAAVGRMDAAAVRADALLRQGRIELVPALRGLVADPGFARAWARQIDGNPAWRSEYMIRISTLDAAQLQAHGALLKSLRNRMPKEQRAYISRAIALGDMAGARSMWRASVAGGVADPGFSLVDDGAALLGWQRTKVEGLEATNENGGTSFLFDGGASGRLLFQDLMLAPGHYRFVFAFSADAPVPEKLFAWSAHCIADSRRVDDGAAAARDRVTLLLSIPATGCPLQRLSLHLAGAAPGQVLLRNVKSSLDFASTSDPASTSN